MIRSGSAHGEAHGVAMLAVANELRRHRRLAAQLPAELAHDASLAPLVEVDLLARQRPFTLAAARVPRGLGRRRRRRANVVEGVTRNGPKWPTCYDRHEPLERTRSGA